MAVTEVALLYSSLATDPDLGELVEMFVDEMPERIEVLERHMSDSNWPELGRFAHQLKGSAGSYGFDQITALAGRVEQAARGGEAEHLIGESLGELLDACRRLRAGTSPQ